MSEAQLKIRTMVWFSLGVLAVMLLVTAYTWMQVPAGAQIPSHWNAAGEVDGYSSKAFGLLLVPALTLSLTALFAVIPRIDPKGTNILRSWPAYRATWGMMMVFMLLMQVFICLAAMRIDIRIGTFIPVATGFMFLIIGYYMGHIKPNFMFGVRTPWTITSELSWTKTHQLAGWLFSALGAIMILGPIFLKGETWVWLMMVGIAVLLVATTTYSYIVWKDDPNREHMKHNNGPDV